MTNDEFTARWAEASPKLEHLIKAYHSVVEYKDSSVRLDHWTEMMEHATRILTDYNLAITWRSRWMAQYVPRTTPDEILEWLRYRAFHGAGFAPGGEPADTVDVKFNYMPLVRINAAAWYRRDDFMTWLCSDYAATWHKKLRVSPATQDMQNALFEVEPNMDADSGADVFFTWSDFDNGSDSPHGAEPCIPQDIWEFICEKLWSEYGATSDAVIWLANID